MVVARAALLSWCAEQAQTPIRMECDAAATAICEVPGMDCGLAGEPLKVEHSTVPVSASTWDEVVWNVWHALPDSEGNLEAPEDVSIRVAGRCIDGHPRRPRAHLKVRGADLTLQFGRLGLWFRFQPAMQALRLHLRAHEAFTQAFVPSLVESVAIASSCEESEAISDAVFGATHPVYAAMHRILIHQFHDVWASYSDGRTSKQPSGKSVPPP